ncbi:putative oxygen-independent coproporphyrinogen III oxidase [Desulfosporosinus orientis DSM 765]|uniref:Heme chaperone HemW n=1 Tax=Desulfosporosinus orientis (strain ATCC 19365 / DSM 765 / NCIMB 8382 / VKM B-1628 / Singapore I) TaxID=768706 RepID=G7WJG7_DESOD|nr:radical SAM family heme chaperone HemW [Desulfosporosinus orientis]AET70404.1 putative oxygen-independent coproporphyrinogen III oxidase [Desulfosporosinus orientis DSM 765]
MPSLYVHVPFCVQKCDYCAFYSHSLRDSSKDLISVYLEGLEIELAKRQKDAPQGVSSLFVGGGTPSVLGARDLERLLVMIRKFFPSDPQREKTMEGNPGTLTEEKIDLIKRYGINRFSLGIQSFDDQLLKSVGRIHTANQARKAIQRLRAAGFTNLNLDLMFGLPGQSMRIWQETIEEAISNSPEHLSLYGLMLEEGTPLYTRCFESNAPCPANERCLLPNEDMQAEMYEWAARRLKQAGYRQYETSNYARRGYECRHNLGYWRGEDYLGFGPGGVTCLNRVRWKNIEDVHTYYLRLLERRSPIDESGEEVLTLRECMAERMILGLRLEEGVHLQSFKNDFEVDLRDIYQGVLERYKNKDVFIIEGDYFRLNPKYAFIANSILQEFV